MVYLILGIVVLMAVAAVIVYWQLIVAEGAYLGSRVVALLYDLFAPRYDGVKQFDPTSDAVMLAEPILGICSSDISGFERPSIAV